MSVPSMARSGARDMARLVVRRPPLGGPAPWLPLMALRVLLFLGLLAAATLWLGPARAVEGVKPTVSGAPVSGMNPGPLPKAAAKPAASKLSVAAKPVDKPVDKALDRPAETAVAAEPRAEMAKPAEPVQVADVKAPEPAPEPVKPAPKPSAYCASIADAAADARFAWQKEQLAALERQVEERIAKLEAKRAEYESWLARRNEFLAKADDGVVAIYTKMRADAAALQLANMPGDAAAAILTKLNARTASAILSEMEAARAAQLARAMTELGKKARESEKS
ncbi:MotE family protein [Methylobacterium sp. J-068]|uniref:MotE family protein n=1 Tax=Methylobacterium sp. J-068 TaxID=2836649 RepID=UPI001FBC12F0|nr:hypothetical protein [Methylobacterium sp. J-068]